MFNDPIPALLHQLYVRLHARGEMLSTAESCTGGLLAGAATELTGASAWFDRGFVTYSNDAKMSLLGVQGSTLDTHGAVSEATAGEMVEGVLAGAPASSWALSTTGIAGPGGAVPGKPVGMVCFGLAYRGAEAAVGRAASAPLLRTFTRQFSGDRSQVRLASVACALELLLDALEARPATGQAAHPA